MGDLQDKEPLQPGGRGKPINSVVSPGRTGVNGSVSSAGSQEFGYEELSNGLTCPTCQGTGKIPRGQEDDLVALIPYRDDRLKPRRTALYVCLAVFICMATAGVLCAFLIPRPITFVEDHVDTIYANMSNGTKLLKVKRTLHLTLMNYFNVTNNNFLSLELTNITMQVVSTFKGHVINDAKTDVISKTIPMRTKLAQFNYTVNVTIKDIDDFPLDFCIEGPTHGIYMIFQTTLYYKFMLQDTQSSLTHYQLVSCVVPPFPHYNEEESHLLVRRSQINNLNIGLENVNR